MIERKKFFQERTAAEIEALQIRQVFNAQGLVRRIDDLDPSSQALEIRAMLPPGRFYRNVETGAEASRKAYKHGDYLALSQPQTQTDALASPEIPLEIRARDFSELGKMREDEINLFGYSFRPVQGRDRLKRVIPFIWLPEGVRLFGYAENQAGGIGVRPYADSSRVKTEGASITVRVPSRTKKKPRYHFKMLHVPIIRNPSNLATVLGLRSALTLNPESEDPAGSKSPHELYNIRYTWETEQEGSEVVTLYPQDVAAYIGIIKNEKLKHNLTPLVMNPFALTSKHGAEFFKKLCNNVLIVDPTLKNKRKLRKLHVAEKSLLWARAISIFGHDDIAFWDPERDGRLRDYNWTLNSG